MEFDSNVDIFSSPEVQSNITDSKVRSESVVEDATVDVETTSDDVIPEDISLPPNFFYLTWMTLLVMRKQRSLSYIQR